MKSVKQLMVYLLMSWGFMTPLLADLDEFPLEKPSVNNEDQSPEDKPQEPDLGIKQDPTAEKQPVKSGQKPETNQAPKPTKQPSKNKPPTTNNSANEQHDQKQPIHWSALGLKGTRNGKLVELDRDVVVTQGNVKLEANRAKIFFNDADEVTKVVVTGDVKMTKQTEQVEDRISARGNKATFYNQERRVTLSGRAALWRGGDVVRGKQISYNLDTGWITVDKVEGVVQPNERVRSQLPANETATPGPSPALKESE